MGDIIRQILIYPISNIVVIFYTIFNNSFILSILAVTILLKAILFPLYKSQIISAKRLNDVKPRLEKINEKYKDDPTKRQIETMALYKEINYKPLGCFTSLLIQIPVVYSFYYVISSIAKGGSMYIYPFVKTIFKLSDNFTFDITEVGINFGKSAREMISSFGWKGEAIPFVIIVGFVAISQFISSFISFKLNPATSESNNKKQTKKKKEEETDPMKNMLANPTQFFLINTIILTLMITNVAWSVPLGLSIYWIIQSIVQLAEQVFLYKTIYKK